MFFWIIRWIRMTFQAIRNVRNRWAPELKQLSDHIEKIEDSLAGTDDCVVDIFNLEQKHDDRIIALENELSSVKASVAALENHLNSEIKKMSDVCEKCPMSVEIKNHFKRMIERDELMQENEQSSEIDSPPNKGYNLRSYVVDENSFDK